MEAGKGFRDRSRTPVVFIEALKKGDLAQVNMNSVYKKIAMFIERDVDKSEFMIDGRFVLAAKLEKDRMMLLLLK